MKQIIATISLVCILIMSSCSKSFIERPPVSSATVDVLYKTDKDFQDAVIGTYQALRNQYGVMFEYGDIRGDDAFIQVSNQPSITNVDVFSINSSDALLNTTWANYYVVINLANNIISKIATADTAVVKNKNRYLGEAEFLRAVAYFDLVRIFGDVQMITRPPSAEEAATTPRSPAATVYNEVIIKDLLDASAKLPLAYTGTEVGRATRGAAKAMLGKVYMTVKDFPKAEAVLAELTTAPYTYALLANYNDLFDYSKNEHHSEYIFDIEYEEGLGGLGSIWTNAFMPNATALLNYYNIRGGFNESLCPTRSFIDLWKANDKRKDVSVRCCGTWTNPATGAVTIFSSSTSQTYTMKYVTSVGTLNDSKANWKVIRYADVLLMYAEALNENGKTAAALAPLNLVHVRAGLTPLTAMSQVDTRDNIALERRFELCFEGHRWFDLVRTGKALATMAPTGMKDYMNVFPVPLTQVRVINNATVFPQNPGYN